MTLTLAAVYADGWDDAVVNPLAPAAARARDAAGEPYSVVLLRTGTGGMATAPDGRRPYAVLDLAWADNYCQLARFDAAGRRISRHELRRTPDGDLFLREVQTWSGPPELDGPEFPRAAARHTTTYLLAGERTDIDEPQGDRGPRRDSIRREQPPRLPRPDFGRWQALLALAGDEGCEIAEAGDHALPVRRADGPPWRPPRPLRPEQVAELFRAGTERSIRDRRLRLSTAPAGMLPLPSGRLVAADPAWLRYDNEPFTVTVAPGTYPVTVSIATFVDDPEHRRIAAARLDVTDRRVVSRELALRDGQDPLDLGAGEFFGFGVDAGMACFVDAEAAARLPELDSDLETFDTDSYAVVGDGAVVAWASGWGDGAYPTWIGRDSSGEIACFVADMLLFPPAEAETRTTGPPAMMS
jgi:hypothetical protein